MPTYYFDSGGTNATFSPTPATTVSSTVFAGWVTQTYTATSTTVWTTWVTTSWDGSIVTGSNGWHCEPAELTAEQQAAQELRTAARREQARSEVLARQRAARRALATLLRFISAEQREELRQHGHFLVRGGASGNLYRIRRGRVANIDVLDGAGAVLLRLCAHPALEVPDSDTMLAQALHLQSAANEEQFVRTANVHPVR